MTRRPSPFRLAPVPILWLALCCAVAYTGEAGGSGHGSGPLARLAGPGGAGVAFSRDGSRILTAGRDQARVWDAATFEPLTEPLKHGEGRKLSVAALSPDGRKVVTAAGEEAWVWDAGAGKPLHVLRHGGGVRAASFSPDGKRVLTGGDDAMARVWDAATGRELLARRNPGVVCSATFSEDGRSVLSVSRHPPRRAHRP